MKDNSQTSNTVQTGGASGPPRLHCGQYTQHVAQNEATNSQWQGMDDGETEKGGLSPATFLVCGTVPGAEEPEKWLRLLLLCSEVPGSWGQRSLPPAPANGQRSCFSGSFLGAFLFEGCDAGYLLDMSLSRGMSRSTQSLGRDEHQVPWPFL